MSWFAEEAGCSPADIDRCALFTFTCERMFAYRTQRVAVSTHHVPPHSYKQFICTSPPCINTILGRPHIKELAAPTHASLLSSSDNPPQPLLCLFPHPHKALRGARFILSTPPTNVRRTDKDGAKSISKQKVTRAVGVTGA